MLRQVYIVHARDFVDSDHEIVGVFSNEHKAMQRLEDFEYGFVLPYGIDVDIPLFND